MSSQQVSRAVQILHIVCHLEWDIFIPFASPKFMLLVSSTTEVSQCLLCYNPSLKVETHTGTVKPVTHWTESDCVCSCLSQWVLTVCRWNSVWYAFFNLQLYLLPVIVIFDVCDWHLHNQWHHFCIGPRRRTIKASSEQLRSLTSIYLLLYSPALISTRDVLWTLSSGISKNPSVYHLVVYFRPAVGLHGPRWLSNPCKVQQIFSCISKCRSF